MARTRLVLLALVGLRSGAATTWESVIDGGVEAIGPIAGGLPGLLVLGVAGAGSVFSMIGLVARRAAR